MSSLRVMRTFYLYIGRHTGLNIQTEQVLNLLLSFSRSLSSLRVLIYAVIHRLGNVVTRMSTNLKYNIARSLGGKQNSQVITSFVDLSRCVKVSLVLSLIP